MEPRRHRRGDLWLRIVSLRRSDRFNGATTSPSWRSLHWLQSHQRRWGFNGATTSPSWRLNFESWNCSHFNWASMEPRRHRRGDPAFTATPTLGVSGFNGATTSPSWRCSTSTTVLFLCKWLQWSHDVTVVEMLGFAVGLPLVRSGFNGATTSPSWR